MMRMRRPVFALTLGLAVLFSASARADIAGPDPLAVRLARAPVSLIGTVVSIEEKAVLVMGTSYRVAVVKVEKGLLGTKGATHVRVAFPEVQNLRRPIQTLAKDQQALLLLSPHAQETFLVSNEYFYGFVYGSAPDFKAQVELAETTAKLLANPQTALRGNDKAERYRMAALLIHRYAGNRRGESKREPIDAEESKLILTALAEGDWSPALVGQREPQLEPLTTFTRLGLTEADGWKPPQDLAQVSIAARKWLAENAGTYRIQRVVPAGK
jgi:hypothetical protein